MSWRLTTAVSLIAVASIAVGCAAELDTDSLNDEHETDVIDQPDDELERAELAFEAGRIEEVEAQRIAEFLLSNGNTVAFFAIPEDDEIIVEESGAQHAQMAMARLDGHSVAEMFLLLAPEHTAVPAAIAERATMQGLSLAGREVTDRIAERIDVDIAALGMDDVPVDKAVGYCTKSAAGVEYFENHSCKTPNYRDSWCDPGSYINGGGWLTLIRQGHNKKKDSHSRTAACVGNGEAKHYYWASVPGEWKTARTWEIPANDQLWRTYDGVIKRYRRIRHKTYHPDTGGFVRAWSEFKN